MLFNVTYEIVTPESAEHGDAAERGFSCEDVNFRDAIFAFEHGGGYVEANCYPVNLDNIPRWFTVYDEGCATGENESRSLHLPDGVTPSSAIRIAHYLGCYGIAN